MAEYAVIIADMRQSRKMSERERHEWQLFLKSAIVQMNEDYQSCIEAQLMITKGDEFQGVIRTLPDAFRIAMGFERLIFPLKLRYGIGFGAIQKMGSNIPIEMDGPAFHRANDALNLAKKRKTGMMFSLDIEEQAEFLNTIMALIAAIKKRWSDTTYKRYWLYKEYGTYEKVAGEENVTVQAVWDSLRNANAIEVIQAEQRIHVLLKQLQHQPA